MGIFGFSLKCSLTLQYFGYEANKCDAQHLAVTSGELLAMFLTCSTLSSSSFEAVAAAGSKSTFLSVSTSVRRSSKKLRDGCFVARDENVGVTGFSFFSGVAGLPRFTIMNVIVHAEQDSE